MVGIGDLSEVRDLTGITDTIDLTDTRIETALGYGRGELYAISLKNDWDTDTDHPLYSKAKMIVEFFAAYWVLIRYAGFSDRAGFLRDQITTLTTSFKKEYDQWSLINEPSGGTTSKFSVVSSAYKTYPLNDVDGEIHRSSVIIPGD